MKKVTLSIVASAAIIFLNGCTTNHSLSVSNKENLSSISKRTESLIGSNVEINSSSPGSFANADSRASLAKLNSTGKRASKPWVGGRMVEVQDDEILPPIFYEAQRFKFSDSKRNTQRVPLQTIAERVTAITSIPMRIAVSGSNLPSGSPMPFVPPSGGQLSPLPTSMPMDNMAAVNLNFGTLPLQEYSTDLSSVNMEWNGNLASFLDHITNQLSLSWSYRAGTIIVEKMLTETFSLSAFGVEQSFRMELTGGNSGTSKNEGTGQSSNSTLEMSERGKTDTLKALQQAIESTVKPVGGSVVLNEATGRFYVTATKDAMTKVRQIIQAEDESMLRQAHIQIDIYSVIREEADEKGVDWNVAFQSLKNNWGASVNSPSTLTSSLGAGLGATILQNPKGTREFANSAAMLKLLNSMGNTAKHSPVSLLAMNRQWARKTNLKTDGYLSETTPSTSSSAGSGSVGLKTSQITTGDKYMVQPAILDNGTIMLKFGISLTELISMFDVSAGEGETFQKVQTPVTTGTDDQGTIRLRPGEAMVVTGLSRKISSDDSRRLSDGVPILFGGSYEKTNKREDFVVVIRAVQLQ